jgi:peptidoglycan/LPS O-acetylase OafA/YrhL
MVNKGKWKRRVLRIVAILLAVFFVLISIFVYRFTKKISNKNSVGTGNKRGFRTDILVIEFV